MVLGSHHRPDVPAADEGHQGKLGTGEEFFDDHLPFPIAAVQQHVAERRLGFIQCRRHHDALAGGQPVVFDDRRERTRLDIREGFFEIGERPVSCRRHSRPGHQPLGKILARLDRGGRLRVTENPQSRRAEPIDDAGRQRRLRAYDRQVNPPFLCKSQQTIDIRILQRNTFRLPGDPGIAGRTIDLRHLRRAAQRIYDGVLTPATSYYQYFLSHDSMLEMSDTRE